MKPRRTKEIMAYSGLNRDMDSKKEGIKEFASKKKNLLEKEFACKFFFLPDFFWIQKRKE